jgi:hypothetical protein
MKKNNLIVFATYWNEIDWIEASLEQIEKLNPKEIIICDGCFDPSKQNCSTDGTREIILAWVSKRENARMISALRVSKLEALFKILVGHKKSKWYFALSLSRIKSLYLTMVSNIYRSNQALTFQKMISISKCWKPGVWTTNIDADQFFSDSMFEDISSYVNVKSNFALLTGKENTFFSNFNTYCEDYEEREYNNMPHKIFQNTNFIPTRGTIVEGWNFKSFNLKNFFKSDFYINKFESKYIGRYNHYKFKFSNNRLLEGYSLGDRKSPNLKKYSFNPYLKKHSSIIKTHFGDQLK